MFSYFKKVFGLRQNATTLPTVQPVVIDPNQHLEGYRFIRSGISGFTKVLIFITAALSFYLENEETIMQGELADIIASLAIAINSVAFIFENGLNYYDNKNSRDDLDEIIVDFNEAKIIFNNIVPVNIIPTTSRFKSYGLENTVSLHAINVMACTLSVGSNVVSLLAKAGILSRAPSTVPLLVSNLSGVGISWLHQHWIGHNLENEKRLYWKGREEIFKTITLAQGSVAPSGNISTLLAPTNRAPVSFKR